MLEQRQIKELKRQLFLVTEEKDNLDQKVLERDIQNAILQKKLAETKESVKTKVERLEYRHLTLKLDNENMKDEIHHFNSAGEKHRKHMAIMENKYNELGGKLVDTQKKMENTAKALQPWMNESELKPGVRQKTTQGTFAQHKLLLEELRKTALIGCKLMKDLENAKVITSRPAPRSKDVEIAQLRLEVKKQYETIVALTAGINENSKQASVISKCILPPLKKPTSALLPQWFNQKYE